MESKKSESAGENPQDFKLRDELASLLQNLQSYQCYLPEKLTKNILNEVGFNSEDSNVYKLLTMLSDQFLNDVVESIILTKKKYFKQQSTEEIQKSKTAQKKQKPSAKTMSLKDLLEDLEEKGLKVFKSPYYPHSDIINEFILKGMNNKRENSGTLKEMPNPSKKLHK